MRALLDVSVLIALLDAAHVHHRSAMNWLEREIANGWASCPITQNGCIRIMSSPAYPAMIPAAQVASRLAEAVGHPGHAFWPDDISLVDSKRIDLARLLGHRQATDAYLLALAVEKGGRFATFDRRVDLSVISGAKEKHLEILAG